MRQWRDEDYPLFASMGADKQVMRYFPGLLTRQESDRLADLIRSRIEENGWGFWAVELLETKEFIGFVGINIPHYDVPVSPCLEIGWRLARKYWGQGYATEAANKALAFAFTQLDYETVHSFAAKENIKSQAVMQRLGLEKMDIVFNHPMVPEDSDLSEHVLYCISKQFWLKNNFL